MRRKYLAQTCNICSRGWGGGGAGVGSLSKIKSQRHQAQNKSYTTTGWVEIIELMIQGNPIGFDSDHQKLDIFLQPWDRPFISSGARRLLRWNILGRGNCKDLSRTLSFSICENRNGKWEGATTMYTHIKHKVSIIHNLTRSWPCTGNTERKSKQKLQ